MHRACAVIVAVALAGCAGPRDGESGRTHVDEVRRVEAVLDDFHKAAAEADEERYFAHFADDGVFLGTDATERWTVDAFRGYAHPHFAEGRGWTYEVKERHVGVSGETAWFDESLENAKLGECRGSGVLRQEGGPWKVVQYNLTIPIPNELAVEFADRIKSREE